MNSITPKQFLLLGGKPLLMHSLSAFPSAYPDISLVLALPADQFSRWQELCDQYDFSIPHQVVAGGETRFHSVQNALPVITGEGLVAIHDGARPLVTRALIRKVFAAAEQSGNCIPVISLNESLRIISGTASHAVDRNTCRIVQTPQVFHTTILKNAYLQPFREQFTDDATVVESIGETIYLVDGDPANLKITNPDDLAAAEILIRQK